MLDLIQNVLQGIYIWGFGGHKNMNEKYSSLIQTRLQISGLNTANKIILEMWNKNKIGS